MKCNITLRLVTPIVLGSPLCLVVRATRHLFNFLDWGNAVVQPQVILLSGIFNRLIREPRDQLARTL